MTMINVLNFLPDFFGMSNKFKNAPNRTKHFFAQNARLGNDVTILK